MSVVYRFSTTDVLSVYYQVYELVRRLLGKRMRKRHNWITLAPKDLSETGFNDACSRMYEVVSRGKNLNGFIHEGCRQQRLALKSFTESRGTLGTDEVEERVDISSQDAKREILTLLMEEELPEITINHVGGPKP
ncbi:hypothetical protein L916_08219 [Phytophthora nicotianae]|uniref:Uncharacterized protein n=1 Tax=Phytophthora nicotianae TaxID=4792 RepID=W2J514_PHYNI|nr:hypothetical protein L916_08219 [Phytophthora nicotianae]